jgi:hypothetical protein
MQIFWTQNFQICLKTIHLFSNSRQPKEILDEQYPDRWIGRGGPRSWPARSPDLNPLDFFLWGHVKNVVYRHPIDTGSHSGSFYYNYS